MKHEKHVFCWCCGGLRDHWANLTEAPADHHPRAPGQQPSLRATCVLGWTRPPASHFPLHEVVSAHSGLGAVGNVSDESIDPPFLSHLPLLQTNSFHDACDRHAAAISRTLAGRLAGGRAAGRARGGVASRERRIMPTLTGHQE